MTDDRSKPREERHPAEVGGMESQFYRLTDGTVARYPGGRTRREWEDQVGTPSYEHADKLGYAEG